MKSMQIIILGLVLSTISYADLAGEKEYFEKECQKEIQSCLESGKMKAFYWCQEKTDRSKGYKMESCYDLEVLNKKIEAGEQ